jgi:CSLREA domain-containing protein
MAGMCSASGAGGYRRLRLPADRRYARGVRWGMLLCAVAVLGLLAPSAHAAITVSTFADESIAGDQTCSLREAILAAEGSPSFPECPGVAASGPTTIALPAGTYHLNTGVLLDFSNGSIVVQGSSGEPSQTVINGDDDATHWGRVIDVGIAAEVTLRGVTVTGGYSPFGATPSTSSGPGETGAAGFGGGGILNNGSLTLENASVTGNTTGGGGAGGGSTGSTGGEGGAGGDGAGIYNNGTLTATDTTISANTSGAGGDGGTGSGILFTGGGGPGGTGAGIENHGIATLTNTTVSGNHAGGGGGGGLFSASGAGGDGGGIFNDGKLIVQASTIADDSAGSGGHGAAGGQGGGIASSSSAALTVAASTLSANRAGDGGDGGVSIFGPGSGGTGGAGGAIFDSGQATLSNDTLAGNSAGNGGTGGPGIGSGNGANGGAAGGGGAIEYANPGSITLTSVTITQNAVGRPGSGGTASGGGVNGASGASASGGAIEDGGSSLRETSTLIATNSRPMCAGSVSDGGTNLAFPGPPIDSSCPGVNGDPKLAPFAPNGGFAQTAALQAGSAAIDQVPVGSTCPETDERGIARPQPAGGKCDIGAYEYAPPTCSPVGAATTPGTSVVVQLSCTDPAGVAVTYALDAPPAHGALSAFDPSTGKVIYTPAAGFTGTETFTFHASDSNGSASSQPVTITVSKRAGGLTPRLTGLRISPSAFADNARRKHSKKPRKTGALVSYVDSLAALTRFTVLAPRPGILAAGRCVKVPRHHRKHVRRCTRYVAVASFSHLDRAGQNSFRFSGMVGGRRLAPGRYRLQAVPSLSGHRGTPVTVPFRIVA